jgi:hypothetical protein
VSSTTASCVLYLACIDPNTQRSVQWLVMSHENVNRNDRSGEAPLLMPQGTRYAGQPVDTSCRHSIEIKPSDGGHALIDPKDAHVVVDYFYHEGQFWRAIIPLDGIAEIFGQAFNFSKVRTKRGAKGPEICFGRDGLPKRTVPFLNHLQCRFVMKSDCYVNLYPIGSDDTGVPAHRIRTSSTPLRLLVRWESASICGTD